MSDATIPVIAPDLAQTRQFLDALDPSPGAQFGYRTFDDRHDDRRLAVKAYGTLVIGVRQSADPAKNGKPCRPAGLIAFMQGKGAGAFIAPNQLDGQGQGGAHVVGIRALFIDADSRPQVKQVRVFIEASGLEPALTVASGGIHDGTDKLQVYWRIEGCPVADFTHAQLTLVSRVGSDPAVQDPGRVMRLPGFWHQKREPRMTRIVLRSGASHKFPAFMARVQAQPQICDPWASGRGTGRRRADVGQPLDAASPTARLRLLLDLHGGLLTPAVRALLGEAKAPTESSPGNRHDTLLAIAARLVQIGWPDADIQALVQPVVIEHWGGDRLERLAGMLAWARRQETAARAAAPPLCARAARLAAAFGAARRAGR